MKKKLILIAVLISGLLYNGYSQQKPIVIPPYPATNKVNLVDDYFGTKVADPYRWLEDDKSSETADWVKEENAVTQKYFDQIPIRADIKDRLTQAWNYPKMSAPVEVAGKQFCFRNTGIQNQDVLYMTDDNNPNGVIVLDPNALFPDGSVSVSFFEVSNDGKYLAYSLSRSGSDWNEICVIDLKKMKQLDDQIKWVKFSGIAWKEKGFYYSRYDQPKEGTELTKSNENHKVYYHKLGTSQSKDELIYEDKANPLRNYQATTSDDERYLFLNMTESTTGNAIYFQDLRKKEGFKDIYQKFNYDLDVIGNIGDSVIIRTNYNADNYALVRIDPLNPGMDKWVTLVEAKPEMVMESAHLAGNVIIVNYLVKATNLLMVFSQGGSELGIIPNKTLGTISSVHSRVNDPKAYYSFTSFTSPNTVYEIDTKFNMFMPRLKFASQTLFNPDDYETKQVIYKSFDQTDIYMFLVYKKGLVLNGSNPVYLYGYGGFSVSMTPVYSPGRMLFLENGGILAIPNIRGGGEFGEPWHLAGTKEKKQTVFNDFIAAARYLINESYTNANKLAISGGSNGGLLVGACMTQNPELFKVALPAVGVMDMLRYHKFTIGWAWKTDYGSSEDETGFKYLYKYSPLHNIKPNVSYPATLVTTADHDDRVVPAHSFKFIATLQEKNKGTNPMLIRIQTKAGHGAGKPTSAKIEEATDIWAFTFYNLGMDISVKAPKQPTEQDLKDKKKPRFSDNPQNQQNKFNYEKSPEVREKDKQPGKK